LNNGSGALIGTDFNLFKRVIAPGDFNGDGHPDVIAIANDGKLYLYPSNGAGAFTGSSLIGSDWQSFTTVIAPGDFSGDGKPDLLAVAANGNLWLYPGSGTGGFGAASVVGSGWNGFASLVAPGDFNGDGKADVIGILPNGNMYLYTGNGASGWTATSVPIGSGWQGFREVVGSRDFTGDGTQDLFGATPSGDLWLYNGSGVGTFSGNSQVGWGW